MVNIRIITLIVAEFYRKLLRESWVVFIPILLSFMITIVMVFSGPHSHFTLEDVLIILCFLFFFFYIMMIGFRLTYKRVYQKLLGDFKWYKFIVFVVIFVLLYTICFLLGGVLTLIASELFSRKEDGLSFGGTFIVAYVLFSFIKNRALSEEKWWKIFIWFLLFYFSICGLVSLFV